MEKIIITRKEHARGEDGYKTFSIRIKEATVAQLDEIAKLTNRSRNELINIFLDHGIENYEVAEEND